MPYIVQTSAAKMPAKVKAPYRRIAILEVKPGYERGVSMISARAKGVVRIVDTWERLHSLGTNTAYARALAEAQARCDTLNRLDAMAKAPLRRTT